jgi:hypothetical protein
MGFKNVHVYFGAVSHGLATGTAVSTKSAPDHRGGRVHGAAGDVGAIVEKLEEFEQHSEAIDVGEDSFDDADDDPFDPTEFIDEDDEF